MSLSKEKLTAKQARFAEEFMVDMNATAAARRAGYSEKTAHVQGPRLLGNVAVAARIAELQDKTAQRLEVTTDDVIQMLLESYVDARAAKQHGPQVRAAELLGRRLGLFKDRVEVSDMARLPVEDLLKSIAGDDPEKLELARRLIDVPEGFSEGETQH